MQEFERIRVEVSGWHGSFYSRNVVGETVAMLFLVHTSFGLLDICKVSLLAVQLP